MANLLKVLYEVVWTEEGTGSKGELLVCVRKEILRIRVIIQALHY